MAKESGSNRCSSWSGNPYTLNGVRREYHELPKDRQDHIRGVSRRVGKEMWENLKGKSVSQTADGRSIKIEFDHKGVDHVARDAMLTLSGKYMSKQSMVNIHHVLANSTYIPTSHQISHVRSDARAIWFKYKDNQGRGIYFSVAYNPKAEKPYTLYSVTDVPPG